MPLSARTRTLAPLTCCPASRRSRTALVTTSSFSSSALRFGSGTISSVLRTDLTPSMRFVISSAAFRSSPEPTLPRSVTTPLCVSTLIRRALTRPSVTSAVFVLEMIQESLISCPAPPFDSAGADVWAGLTAGQAISTVNTRKIRAIFMEAPFPDGLVSKWCAKSGASGGFVYLSVSSAARGAPPMRWTHARRVSCLSRPPSPRRFWHPQDASLAAGHGPDDQERLGARRDGVGQRGVRRLVGEILLAGEEPHERPALLRDVVADRPAQHRIAGLERVEDRARRGDTLDVELHLTVDVRERPQMRREHDPDDHGNVWTSTDTTDGRSRTMGVDRKSTRLNSSHITISYAVFCLKKKKKQKQYHRKKDDISIPSATQRQSTLQT